MNAKMLGLTLFLTLVVSLNSAFASTGATVPWTTYEAEAMTINGGTILGPPPVAVDKNATVTNTVEGESSGRQCVRLAGSGQYVQFAAQTTANTLVVRYSVPDTADGVGADYTISLYLNGNFVQKIPVSSKYSWLYGGYTFSNNPGDGNARNFFDEARVMNLTINPGDLVRLQMDANDTAAYYILDLVDLENIGSPLTQPPGSQSVLACGAVGNGVADDTLAINNCVNQGGTVWFPPGNYLVTGDINVPPGTTIQGAGMWYTTFVGSPTTYVNEQGRVRFNGEGSNTHFADFAILGKLNNRNDSQANDGFSEIFGTNSSIARVWVEHTKTGAWLANALGMLVTDCRFRNTIADGINIDVGMQGCIVSNCTARGTGDDSFAIWPATYRTAAYQPGYNVFTHCTAQSPWFANACGIYGGISNRVEDCRFVDTTDGCGILIAGTFPIGPYVFAGTTVAQRCDLVRCGGFDPGWQWRGALTLCPQNIDINGVQINNLNISNSLSYAIQIVDPGGGVVTNATMSSVNASGYALGVHVFHPQNNCCSNVFVDGVFGVLARSDAKGSITVTDLVVSNTPIISQQTPGTIFTNQSNGQFIFNFLTQPISVTVQANSAGHSFIVDSVTYTNAQTFTWTQGSIHTIATTTPQNSGTGVQDVWNSWSDGGAISHTVSPLVSTTYTASFGTQYYLTMNASAGGSVSPVSGWQNSNAVVNISATPSLGFQFSSWNGTGSGSFSGTNSSASVTMNAPITQTAFFSSPQVQSMSFAQQPGNVLQGAIITPEVQVQAIDTNGSPVAAAAITLSLGSGTGNLTGTLTRVTDGGGLAHFADLSVNQPGPKVLTATAGSGPASPTNSSSFMVIGSVTALAFTTQPGGAVPGQPFSQQPVVKTVDTFGTPTTSGLPSSLIVYVSLTNGVGTLSGTTSLDIGTSAGNGVVAFGNLSIDTAGTNDQLIASVAPVMTGNPVAGAVLWLDANDPSTITTNGTRVQAWKNKGTGGTTGANLWFTQNTTGLQPLRTNQMGGKPVLTFSKNGNGYGTGCTYLGNVGLNSYTNSGSQMSYFLVARQSSNTYGWQGPISFSRSGQTDGQGAAGVVILTDGSQSAPYPFGIQRNHPATPMQADVASSALNTPFLLSFLDNGGAAILRLTDSTGSSRSNSANIVNGISPYKYNITDVTVGGRLEPSPSTIDNGWDGDVAEVLVYNTALSVADRSSVETYLSNKWFVSSVVLSVSNAISAPFPVQSTLSVTVQANPPGLSFMVDGTAYTNAQIFSWTTGSNHTIATTTPQGGGAGVQYAWSSWSDGGPISHTVSPTVTANYTANFATQYFLTMNASPEGSVSPSSNWYNNGTNVNISASALSGYAFDAWTGTGSGSYSGTNNPASITINGPIMQTAGFDFLAAITGITIGGDGSVTISYSTTSGLTYHVETTTDLTSSAWTTVPGSTTNAAGSLIIFVDPNAMGDPQRFYRVGSP
ncbi:MAG TPA: glycosyl hydrolase family 28-related protein [Verrucomicrobiae bacterium]|nr:glycosyl hydrolase family 28-related protein [Verrucomicrobiae bacterium]